MAEVPGPVMSPEEQLAQSRMMQQLNPKPARAPAPPLAVTPQNPQRSGLLVEALRKRMSGVDE